MASLDSEPAGCQKHIVLVEDDKRLSALITSYLESLSYEVLPVYRGDEAVSFVIDQQPDLVILDYMLPGKDGFEVCADLRPIYTGPILMLTASDDDLTEVSALNRGIDDFMTKPLRPHVLLARIEALFRRSPSLAKTVHKPGSSFGKHRCRDIVLNVSTREVLKADVPLELTDAEFDLLAILIEEPGKIVSRDDLFLLLRGIEYDGIDRSIDQRISTLRRKLDDAEPPHHYLKSVRSKGYMLIPDD